MNEEALTTKSEVYRSARRKLEQRWAEISTMDLAAILGVSDTTARKYAQDGRYGARREHSNAPYRFDVNEIRADLGLPLLPDSIG